MKKWFVLASLVLIVGCEPENTDEPRVVFQNTDERLSVSSLGDNDYGRWRLIELKYDGKKYVFIQNYDRDNQSMVKVGEYNLQAEITELP